MSCCTPRLCGCLPKINDTSKPKPVEPPVEPPMPDPVVVRKEDHILDGGVAYEYETGVTSAAEAMNNIYFLLKEPLRYSKEEYYIVSSYLTDGGVGIYSDGGVYLNSNEMTFVSGEIVHRPSNQTEVEFTVQLTYKYRSWRDDQ